MYDPFKTELDYTKESDDSGQITYFWSDGVITNTPSDDEPDNAVGIIQDVFNTCEYGVVYEGDVIELSDMSYYGLDKTSTVWHD